MMAGALFMEAKHLLGGEISKGLGKKCVKITFFCRKFSGWKFIP
jgi:hypothetical protein